jgi:hypothetical protein
VIRVPIDVLHSDMDFVALPPGTAAKCEVVEVSGAETLACQRIASYEGVWKDSGGKDRFCKMHYWEIRKG